MKLKRLILASLATTLSLSVIANATTRTTDNVVSTISIDNSSGLETVAGFVAEIKYDAKALVPHLLGIDLLDDDLYANKLIDKGILSADLVAGDDGNNTIVVAWADRKETELSDTSNFANITFDVLDNPECDGDGCTTISTKISNISTSRDTMAEDLIIEKSNKFAIVQVNDSTESGSSIEVDTDDVESGSAIAID